MSQAPGTWLYVYYKLRASDAAAAQACFEAAAARLGASVRLQQRADAGLDATLLTWMEIYEPDGLDAEPLMAEAMAPWAQGGRHVERFVAINTRVA